MVDTNIRSNYSPDVLMRLEVDGRSWPVAKLCSDHFVPAERFDLKACTADIVLTIDGKERRWTVRLTKGVCFFDSDVPISTI